MSRSSYGQVRGPLAQYVEGFRGLTAHLSRWLAGGRPGPSPLTQARVDAYFAQCCPAGYVK